VHAARRGDELTGVTVTGLLTCLISPISWTHHLYWVVPASLVLVDVAAGTPLDDRAPAVLRSAPRTVRATAGVAALALVTAVVVSLPWYFGAAQRGHHHDGGPVGMLGENAYLLIMIALVLLLPVRGVRSRSDRVWGPEASRSVGWGRSSQLGDGS
jgi:alpha-1,2-mannosyltransferase